MSSSMLADKHMLIVFHQIQRTADEAGLKARHL